MGRMSQLSPSALSTCVREVVEFVDAAGWDQPPQLFALVPTAELLAEEPGLAGTLTADLELTPVAQDALPGGAGGGPADGSPELDAALGAILWPDGVAGCALVQEVLILPPGAAAELDAMVTRSAADDRAVVERTAVEHAAAHPERQEARLVAAVLRSGESLCLLQLRAVNTPELLEHPDLAPNLVAALRATLEA